MARSWFGGTHLDIVIRPWPWGQRRLADLAGSTRVRFYDAAEGGSQITDLLLDGSPVNGIDTDADGYLPGFQGPDGVHTLWADAGFGRRFLVVTTDGAIDLSEQLSTRIPTSEKGALNGVATLDGAGRLAEAVDAGKIDSGTIAEPRLPDHLQVSSLDDRIAAGVGAAAATADVRFFHHTGWAGGDYDYEVIHVRSGGPIPRLLQKRYAGDYELEGTSGEDFKPPEELPSDMFAREGHSIIVNTEGWRRSTTKEIWGCQIKDGVVYHDFEDSENPQGTDTLGFRADGTARTYSARRGDTASDLIVDGVVDCFGFGPSLVVDGLEEDLESNPQWGAWNTDPSGRQILGVTAEGEIVIISVWGKSGSGAFGIYGNEIAAVAKRHGCHQAIMLDGGGSAQSYITGAYGHCSTDSGLERPVPAWGCLRVQVSSLPEPDRVLQVRRVLDRLELRGRARKVSGTFTVGTFETIGTLPRWAVSARPHASQATSTSGDGAQLSVTSAAPRDLQVRHATADTYVDLGGHTYSWL